MTLIFVINEHNNKTKKVWYKGLLKRLLETSGGLGVFEGDLFKVYWGCFLVRLGVVLLG